MDCRAASLNCCVRAKNYETILLRDAIRDKFGTRCSGADFHHARARLRSQGVTTRPSPKVSWLLSTEGHTSASYFACIVCGAIRNPNPHCSERFNSDHLPRCRHHPARGGRGPGRPSNKMGSPYVFQEFACAPGPHARKCPFHPDNFAQAGGAAVLETGLPMRKRFQTIDNQRW